MISEDVTHGDDSVRLIFSKSHIRPQPPSHDVLQVFGSIYPPTCLGRPVRILNLTHIAYMKAMVGKCLGFYLEMTVLSILLIKVE
jgi:hypothetical protein